MMNILHSGDLHLDTPFRMRTPEQAEYLRQQLLTVPQKLADLCRQEQCQLMLLSGDLFDTTPTSESLNALRYALEDAAVPVFIAPGNHDPLLPDSPYLTSPWPSNVHIFTQPRITAVTLEELDCKIYGAGYRSMDCPGLLQGFQAEGSERYHIGVLHGDPTNAASPCCPVTADQIRQSGLDYLALGHIHKAGSVRYGETLCAWPGCPMGRGFDETGYKGALILSLGEETAVTPVQLSTPSFFDLELTASQLSQELSALGSKDIYRITLIGEDTSADLHTLYQQYAHFPFLELRDHRKAMPDLWSLNHSDSLEGTFFRILKENLDQADPREQELITLAARISRQLLESEEVTLP